MNQSLLLAVFCVVIQCSCTQRHPAADGPPKSPQTGLVGIDMSKPIFDQGVPLCPEIGKYSKEVYKPEATCVSAGPGARNASVYVDDTHAPVFMKHRRMYVYLDAHGKPEKLTLPVHDFLTQEASLTMNSKFGAGELISRNPSMWYWRFRDYALTFVESQDDHSYIEMRTDARVSADGARFEAALQAEKEKL